MDENDTPGTGWFEEWEISDLDEPAQRVSFIEGSERMAKALFTTMAALSLPGLFVLGWAGKISGGEFTACFLALVFVSGGAAVLIEHPEYLQRLAGFARNAGGMLRTIEALGGQDKGNTARNTRRAPDRDHGGRDRDDDQFDGDDQAEAEDQGR